MCPYFRSILKEGYHYKTDTQAKTYVVAFLLSCFFLQLSLRTVNSAHSAFVNFLFCRKFFSSYSDGLGSRPAGERGDEEEEEEDTIKCKITIKVSPAQFACSEHTYVGPTIRRDIIAYIQFPTYSGTSEQGTLWGQQFCPL